MEGRFVAYYRVSTARQGASGLGLDAQKEAVRSFLSGGKWHLVAEVTEVESGKRSDRPKLVEALRLCRLHGATLVIAKLDRLSRNVAFIATLMEAGTDFVAVDMPLANRLTVHILSAVAEHEAQMISARTKAALAAAKARGTRLGGDRGRFMSVRDRGHAVGLKVRQAKAGKLANDLLPVIRELQADGMSLGFIARELTRRGYLTSRGNTKWRVTQVQRILSHQRL